MFPFWMDCSWLSLPQFLSLLAATIAVLLRVATGPR